MIGRYLDIVLIKYFQSIDAFRWTLVGINLGFCNGGMPELFTNVLALSIHTWVEKGAKLYSGAGPGPLGSAQSRTELSACQKILDHAITTTTTEHVPYAPTVTRYLQYYIDIAMKS